MQRGNVIVKQNHFLGRKGGGRYLKRGKSILAEQSEIKDERL